MLFLYFSKINNTMLEKYNLFIRDTYISHFKFIIDSEFNSLFNKFKKQDIIYNFNWFIFIHIFWL